jgi:hypothetical protein
MWECLSQESVLGFKSFQIQADEFDKQFISAHRRRVLSQKEASVDASEGPTDENAMHKWNRDEFIEMMAACGYYKVPHVNGVHECIVFVWCPAMIIWKAYRFASNITRQQKGEGNSRVQDKLRCPQMLKEAGQMLKEAGVHAYADSLTPDPYWSSDFEHLLLKEDQILQRLKECEKYFFPFTMLDYDIEIMPQLFTRMDDRKTTLDEFNGEAQYYKTSQANLTMTKKFFDKMQIYYRWLISKQGIVKLDLASLKDVGTLPCSDVGTLDNTQALSGLKQSAPTDNNHTAKRVKL